MRTADPIPTSFPVYEGIQMDPERIFDSFREYATDFLNTYGHFADKFPSMGSNFLEMAHRDLEKLKEEYGKVSGAAETYGKREELEQLLFAAIDLCHRPSALKLLSSKVLSNVGAQNA